MIYYGVMKGKIFAGLRVVVSVGLIAFLVFSMREHLPRIGETLTKTHPGLFSLALILFALNVVAISYRLQILLVGEGLRIPFGSVVQLSFIGFFFNNFMPTAVGGDIVKAYYVQKHTGKPAKSFIAVFMDRFIGVFSFVVIALLALAFSWENTNDVLKGTIFIFALSSAIGLFIILNSGVAKIVLKALSAFQIWDIGGKLSKVYKAVHEYRNKKTLIIVSGGVSIASQSLYFFIVYLLGKSLGAELPILAIFLIMPLVSIVSMMPSLGGLGLREGALVALLGPVIGTDNAFSVAILLLATLLIMSLIGAMIYLSAAQFRIKGTDISKLEKYSV